MNDRHDDPRWIALGTDVAEGRPVDWDSVRREAGDDESRALLASLEQVAGVVRAHHAEQDLPPSASLDRAGRARHWLHLVLLEQVGAGTFGTVFRAWDTQLDREVALKILSKERTAGQSPLTEARHLARVRHPNVVTVFGAEQHEDQVGIWMEYIQGETLADMVHRGGPLSVREASGVGIEVCRALSALHGRSLLHRDIKAQNVMREVGGRIVLMDFSGVRAVEQADPAGQLSGTPLYMAPELFEGRPGTVASDIYSLGVLVFYLLSGRYPVEGATLGTVRSAHGRQERLRLRDLRSELSDAIIHVVERALSSDPAQRYRTAGEFEEALALAAHATATPLAVGASDASAAGWWRPRRLLPLAAGLALGVAATMAVVMSRPEPRPADPLLVRLAVGPPYNTISWPRISPDGRYVVYGGVAETNTASGMAGREMLLLRPLGSLTGRPLVETTVRETAFWSADSRRVAFFEDGKLKQIAIEGGRQPHVLADAPSPFGGDANGEGTLLFSANSVLYRVGWDGTGLAQVTSLDTARGENRHSWPEFLPDGRRFLFLVRSADPRQSGLYLGSLDSPERTRLMPAFSRTAYSPSGHLLFVRDGTLIAQPFDPDAGRLAGDSQPVASYVKAHTSSDAAFDVSNNGVLIYRLAEGTPSLRLELHDRRGRALEVLTPTGFYRHPRFSPDGQRIAVERLETGDANPDIWLYDRVRQSFTKFTTHEAPDVRPTWSPDGRRIAFSSRRGTYYDIYTKTVDGTDPERAVDTSPGDKLVEHWAKGDRLLVTVVRSGLWMRPFGGGERTLIRPSGTADTFQAELSPDGRWLAYVTTESGIAVVYVEPVPATGERWLISTRGGAEPHWRGDGRELFYLALDGSVMSVEVPAGGEWRASNPVWLLQANVLEPFGTSDLAVSPDGEHMVVNTLLGEGPVPPIQVVVNWSELLRN